jgi:hypothetical protein
MTFDVKLSITGIQEAQAKNNRNMAALRPEGALGRAVQYGTMAAHRYAIGVTHVDTGALRGSHRMELAGLRGRVYIAPEAMNPRSGQKTTLYGPYEHQRGGEHAFYQRVIDQYGQEIEQQMNGLVKLGITP